MSNPSPWIEIPTGKPSLAEAIATSPVYAGLRDALDLLQARSVGHQERTS